MKNIEFVEVLLPAKSSKIYKGLSLQYAAKQILKDGKVLKTKFGNWLYKFWLTKVNISEAVERSVGDEFAADILYSIYAFIMKFIPRLR
jgi:hypothetical protein